MMIVLFYLSKKKNWFKIKGLKFISSNNCKILTILPILQLSSKVTLDLYKRARNNNFFGWFSKQESYINAWNFTAIIWGRNVIGTTNIEHVKMAQTCWIHKSFLFENLVEGYHFHI